MAEHRLATTPADLAVAARLLVDFNTEYDWPVPEVEWLAEHLRQLVATGDTLVPMVGEPAIGVAVLRLRTQTWSVAPEAYVAELYVQRARRGEGIGSRFLAWILDQLRERGVTYVDLGTTVDDHAARHVYEKLGFSCHENGPDGPLSVYYELDLS